MYLTLQLVTAPLTRGDILAGVTRDSILELTRGWTSNHGPGAGTISNLLCRVFSVWVCLLW
jgi:branched-subunit amino acid aminotransferase/4-amino-4-deoxychorismate lyase